MKLPIKKYYIREPKQNPYWTNHYGRISFLKYLIKEYES